MQFRKAIIRVTGFLAGLVIMLLLMGIIFSPGRWYPGGYIQDRNARTAMLSCEKPERIDIVNVGDSESGTGFSTMAVWEQKGYTSLNIGCDGMTFPECYTVLRKMFRTQSPRVVLLETNLFTRTGKRVLSKSFVAETVYDIFEGLRFHNVWKSFWKDKGSRLNFKGYIVNERVLPYTGPTDYMQPSDEQESFGGSTELWLHVIQSLCEKNGARLVLWSCASPKNYWMERHNGIQAEADKRGLMYLDCNMHQDEIGLDWSLDTPDAGDHMNCSGAEKTAVWMVSCLEDSIGLEDHRQDASFAEEWDPIFARYQEIKAVMDGYYADDLPPEIADYIQNGGDFRQPGYERE